MTLNNEKKPFSDPRVRRALTSPSTATKLRKALSQISVMKYIGGIYRPGSEFATPPGGLAKLPGFGKDINAARDEAKRLLKEAGVPEGFSFVLKNRNVKEPYEVSGVLSSISGARSVLTSPTRRWRAGRISTICGKATSTPALISTASSWTSPISICSST